MTKIVDNEPCQIIEYNKRNIFHADSYIKLDENLVLDSFIKNRN